MDGSDNTERQRYLEAAWYGLNLRAVPERYRADRQIVLRAVQQDGRALQHAAEDCKADRRIVLAAVHNDGWALHYAAEECQADPRGRGPPGAEGT
eukprot:5633515-Amphidinium_carterae.1